MIRSYNQNGKKKDTSHDHHMIKAPSRQKQASTRIKRKILHIIKKMEEEWNNDYKKNLFTVNQDENDSTISNEIHYSILHWEQQSKILNKEDLKDFETLWNNKLTRQDN